MPTNDPSDLGDSNANQIVIALVLLVVTILFVFGQTVGFEFLMWDDETVVVESVKRAGGLNPQSVAWAFTNRVHGWRTPLTYISLFANAELFGLNPGGYHLTNLLIHITSTLLLFAILLRATCHVWASTIAAALFAIHPLHVEPVAWVTGRWELMCGFFWLLGLWFYVRYCGAPSWLRHVPVAICYILALVSKPMALTFPFALLLFDYWPLQRLLGSRPTNAKDETDQTARFPEIPWTRALVEKLPLFAIMAVSTIMIFVAKSADVAPRGLANFTLAERTANSLETYAIYLAKFFWPSRLTFFYVHPVLTGGFSVWRVATAATVVVLITAVVLRLARQHPYLAVGWLWYLGVFTPAIGWVQVEHHARADRYTYLPLIGLTWMLCWGLPAALRSLSWRKLALGFAAAGMILAMTFAARNQARHWRNSSALFEYGLSVDPNNYKALVGLGTLAARDGDFERAAEYYQRVVELLPGHSQATYLLGRCHFQQERYSEAIEMLQRALELDPGSTRAQRMLAESYGEQDNHETALKEFEKLVLLRPGDPQPHKWFGSYLARQQDDAGAVEQYQIGLELDPMDTEFCRRIAAVHISAGRPAEAIRCYESYLADYPRSRDVSLALAWLLATHPDQAVRNPTKAKKIATRLCDSTDFQDDFAVDALAAALAAEGAYNEAVETLSRAIASARARGDQNRVDQFSERLKLYQNGQPYLQPSQLDSAAPRR